MSSSQIFQGLLSLPARSRQLIGNWRGRVTSGEAAKREGQILGRSLLIHRPVWATGGTAMYTTAGAVYLTLRCLKRIR